MEFDFSANVQVPDISKIPEQFRPLYAKDEESGAFKLRSEDSAVKGAVEAITGLNKALKSERALTADLKKKQVDLAPLGDYGKSVDEIAAGVRAKLEELQGQIAGAGKAKLDLEKIKADLAAAHAKDVGVKDTTIKSLQEQLRSILIDQQIRGALGDKAVSVELALPHVSSRVQAVQEDGQFKVFVVDKDGSRRYSGMTGQPMTINELVEEMRASESYQPLFKSVAPKGSGTPPAGARAGSFSGDRSKLTANQKIELGLAKRR